MLFDNQRDLSDKDICKNVHRNCLHYTKSRIGAA